MNTNMVHNVLNLLIAVLGTLVGFDWSSIVSQPVALKLIAMLSIAKLLMNTIRDGFTGLVENQPPVQK